MICIELFVTFLKVGLFAVGGAYSFLPLLERELVQRHRWLSPQEFLDILGIVKIFPGAISIKVATYTGYKLGGPAGVIAANAGNFFAPVVLILGTSVLYMRFKDHPAVHGALQVVQLAACGMILAVGVRFLSLREWTDVRNLAVVAGAFAIFALTDVHPAWVILGGALAGALWW